MFKLFLLIIALIITTSANAAQCLAQPKWQSYLNGVSYNFGLMIKQDKIYLVLSNINDTGFTLQAFSAAGKKYLVIELQNFLPLHPQSMMREICILVMAKG